MINENVLVQFFIDVHTALRTDLATRTQAIQSKKALSSQDVDRLYK